MTTEQLRARAEQVAAQLGPIDPAAHGSIIALMSDALQKQRRTGTTTKTPGRDRAA